MTPDLNIIDPPQSDLARENAGLRAQVMNLMGKLDVRENFVPRIIVDLASQLKLQVTADENGCLARIKSSRTPEMGS